MENEYISFSEAPNYPYSDLVVVEGRYLFLSGLVSEDMVTGELLCGDIAFETRQVLTNLKKILEKYGSDMEHVVRMEVILSDFSQRDAMNQEYIRHFSREHMPARVCFGGACLADNCKIEIMATAVKK